MTEPAKARNPWMLPSIAGVVALLSLFVPISCNASANGTAYATQDGGPLVLGALAIVLAAWALTRVRRGAPAVIALVVAVAGGVQVAHGVTLMQRVRSEAEQVDLDGPVRQFFERMRDDQIVAIMADAEPEVQKEGAPLLDAMARGYARGFGRWQSITPGDRKENGDRVAALGEARFERGVMHYEITFRMRGGVPHLAGFDLTIPADKVPPASGADQAAHELADAVVAGATDRVRDHLDPRIELPADLDAKIRQMHDLVAPSPKIELVSSAKCDAAQCVEMRISAPPAVINVHLQLTPTFGMWLASSFKFDSSVGVKL